MLGNKKIRIAFFDTKPYDQTSFNACNEKKRLK